MTRITQELRDDITSAMMGVLDRYGDVDAIDMPPMARDLAAECCRIIQSLDRGPTAMLIRTPLNWEAISRAITVAEVNGLTGTITLEGLQR